jgi:hypothetical protein
MAPVTTGQIYWGAVPFVIIQLIMVGLVIAFPQMVMVYKDDAPKPGQNKIEIVLPPGDSATDANAPGAQDKKEADTDGNDDLMKSLGGQSSEAKADEQSKADAAADDIMKAFGGKPEAPSKADTKAEAAPAKGTADSKSPPAKSKTKEELAAEEIEKALRGGK